jgi:hypothetical protein
LNQVAAEIHSWRPNLEDVHNIKVTADRPKKFYFAQVSDEQVLEEIEASEQTKRGAATDLEPRQELSEHDLYPILSEFLASELRLYSRRINEKTSSNKRGANANKWLHPDLVGVEILSAGWTEQVKRVVNARNERTTRIWSFEVKKVLNTSNVRESFFQALSNSAWANFGYLVAAEILNERAENELRVLANQHGIGLILLDTAAPGESQIRIPAAERQDVDWSAVNRLVDENSDAQEVFEVISIIEQTSDPQTARWDNGPRKTSEV